MGLWVQDLRSIWTDLDEALTTQDGTDWNVLGSIKQYRQLTELTRNPRSTRNEIEKNWVLFFPREDEAWVQYDVMGQLEESVEAGHADIMGGTLLESQPGHEKHDVHGRKVGIYSNVTINRRARNDRFSRNETITRNEKVAAHVGSGKVDGGRTIAQISSNGFTTENMTSQHEKSCFDVRSHKHNYDTHGRHGHWHQGTNSLRMVACTRKEMRRRTCHGPTNHNLTHHEYEELLIREGLVFHFSFIHRKFTGQFAPLRYERYLLLWEARQPFQLLGVSQFPILFNNERARPWNITGDGREIGEYFTYTPSIAWAWKKYTGGDAEIDRERGHEDLGTGYVDDEVVIGIGIDDTAQGVVKLPVKDLLSCIKLCSELL